jgi:hypothetical protein
LSNKSNSSRKCPISSVNAFKTNMLLNNNLLLFNNNINKNKIDLLILNKNQV